MPRVDGRIDPALLAALDDPIMIDPTLSQSSNRLAVRPAEAPSGAAYPVAGRAVDMAGCAGALRRDRAWAARLPLAFPDGARLIEAAGLGDGDCAVTVVRFRVAQAPAAVVDHYFKRTIRAGLSATQLARGGEQVLVGGAGARSYLVLARPAPGGAEVGLVVRGGGWPRPAHPPTAPR